MFHELSSVRPGRAAFYGYRMLIPICVRTSNADTCCTMHESALTHRAACIHACCILERDSVRRCRADRDASRGRGSILAGMSSIVPTRAAAARSVRSRGSLRSALWSTALADCASLTAIGSHAMLNFAERAAYHARTRHINELSHLRIDSHQLGGYNRSSRPMWGPVALQYIAEGSINGLHPQLHRVLPTY